MPHIMIFARADAESGQALIQISDNGPGIREEMRDRIFYPFFTTKIHGTGIGLAMARKIVEAHRGVIDVSGTKGEGATFSIRLPLSAAPMGFDKGALSPGILEGMIPAGR